MEKLKVEYISPGELKSYENNAKIHTAEQVEQIKNSIKEFGFNDPIAVWKDNVVIEGHGRLIAATELGLDKVPVIRLDGLTDEQRRAYTIVHNKLTMNTGFDFDLLEQELQELQNTDMAKYGFESIGEVDIDAMFDNREETDTSDDNENSREGKTLFVECPHCGENVMVE